MKALRHLFSLNKRNPSPFVPQLAAASYTLSGANPNRFSTSSFDNSDEEGSIAYQPKLKSLRPTVIPWQDNSASFIGTVQYPLRVANTGLGRSFGVYTSLRVRNSPQSTAEFCIKLTMWDEMAVLCFKHLQPNDSIYVSGHLSSNTKVDVNGTSRLYHQLVVKELNYIAQDGQESSSKIHKEPQFDARAQLDAGETGLDKLKERLYLWQVFLANPYEWWDNRNKKGNTRSADFKHKDTGEALWLSPDDPPWIERQLQLLNLRSAEQGLQIGYRPPRPRISKWEDNEEE